MIRAILFDFGQTIVDSAEGFRTAERETETRIFEDLGLESWPEFLSQYRRLRQGFHANSNFSRVALWRRVYLNYSRRPDRGFLLKAECDYWETVKSEMRLFPETNAVLEQLAPRFQLGLITNTQGQAASGKHRLSLVPELTGFFEVIVVAGEASVPAKPDPEPFRLCLEKLNVAPAEAIYVGDDWRIDICGAERAGIQPVWLQHQAVTRKWPSVERAVPIITSLEPLLDLESLGIQSASRAGTLAAR